MGGAVAPDWRYLYGDRDSFHRYCRDAGRQGCSLAGACSCRLPWPDVSLCDRMASRTSWYASVDVKKILREKIYEKMLALGASYKEYIATSEVVQMSGEGVEQLEIYFGKYLPQLFYSLLAPVTLFLVLSRISLKASVILLICVPMIPLSIVAVQKIAGRLFRRYWGYLFQSGGCFFWKISRD